MKNGSPDRLDFLFGRASLTCLNAAAPVGAINLNMGDQTLQIVFACAIVGVLSAPVTAYADALPIYDIAVPIMVMLFGWKQIVRKTKNYSTAARKR